MNHLVLIPHIDSPVTNGIVKNLLLNKHRVYIYSFNEKPNQETAIHGAYSTNYSVNKNLHGCNRGLLSTEETSAEVDNLLSIFLQTKFECIWSGKHRHEVVSKIYAEKAKVNSYVQELTLLKKLFDRKYLFKISEQLNLNDAKLRKSDSAETFIKPRYEWQRFDGKHAENANTEDLYIKCRKLSYPEINHTVLLKDGRCVFSGMYSIDNKTTGIPQRNICHNNPVKEYTEKLMSRLFEEHHSNADGLYNLDYLYDKNLNQFCLSEINPGRLPAGHDIFKDDLAYQKIFR